MKRSCWSMPVSPTFFRWLLRKMGLTRHVGPPLGRVRFGIIGGKLGRLVDDVPHATIDLLELVLADPLVLEKPGAYLLDRVVLGTHLLDLLAGAVLCRVRHRVAAIAVGHHLENVGAFAGATPGDRLL